MNYLKEVDEILEMICPKEDLSEVEYQEMISEILGNLNLTKEKLVDQLKEGVDNGHSVEVQKSLLKSLFQYLKQ